MSIFSGKIPLFQGFNCSKFGFFRAIHCYIFLEKRKKEENVLPYCDDLFFFQDFGFNRDFF